jgi:hypothetical protein
VLNIEQSLSDYYFSTIPKAYRPRKQAFPAHISVVRKELPANLEHWGEHEGKIVVFDYEHYVRYDPPYFWIDCYSIELEAIRTELGLHNAPLHPASYHTPMPEGMPYLKRFHCTIGNTKDSK